MNKVRKVELGVATGIYLLLIFALLYKCITYNIFDLQHLYGYKFHEYHQVFDYYKHYLLPLLAHITILYLAFVFIHIIVVPRYYEEQRYKMGIFLTLLAIGAVYLTLTIAFTWYYGYLFGVYKTVQGAHTHCAKQAFVLTIFYTILYIVYYAVRRFYFEWVEPQFSGRPSFKTIRTDAIIISLLSIVGLVLFSGSRVSHIVLILGVEIFYAFVYFFTQYKIFPDYYQHRDNRLLFRTLAIFSLMVMVLPFIFAIATADHGPDRVFALLFVIYWGQVMVVMPLSWWIHKSRHAQAATVMGLRKALTHSEAGLDFLRWQINPHFLFNALNTLYGTALQEKAESTSQGIQKLGDMMRFMLHDNLQERIPLSKEIAYLQNYIALQELRTQSSPFINIEVNLDEAKCDDHPIVPMLLIPFVENAFKHGVSLRKLSRISISLSCTSEKIFFDVYNTVHANRSTDNDLEQQESMGIGLKNVRQRLELLYPAKHELSIRETTNEFFVHLTLIV